jgi:S-adenosylmethionine decarboxylase
LRAKQICVNVREINCRVKWTYKMDTYALHLLVELHGCDRGFLDDADLVCEAMQSGALAAGATVLERVAHRYSPQGVSIVLVLAESHFAIHTWPENRYAGVDFYTCGQCNPQEAVPVLACSLGAERVETLFVRRGVRDEAPSIHVEALISRLSVRRITVAQSI